MSGDPPTGGEVLSPRPEALVIELLSEGLSAEIPVTGSSMAPCIRAYDVVSMVPTADRTLRRGDIVAFPRPDGRLVIHRVVDLDGDRILTRGDAAPGDDGWIERQTVVGRVYRVGRRGRLARLGLGPESALFAALSRTGLLAPLLRPFRWLARRSGP